MLKLVLSSTIFLLPLKLLISHQHMKTHHLFWQDAAICCFMTKSQDTRGAVLIIIIMTLALSITLRGFCRQSTNGISKRSLAIGLNAHFFSITVNQLWPLLKCFPVLHKSVRPYLHAVEHNEKGRGYNKMQLFVHFIGLSKLLESIKHVKVVWWKCV